MISTDEKPASPWATLRAELSAAKKDIFSLRSNSRSQKERIRELEHENALLKASSNAAPAEYWRIRDGLVRASVQLRTCAMHYASGYDSYRIYATEAARVAEVALMPPSGVTT